jgi:hypothetical protein
VIPNYLVATEKMAPIPRLRAKGARLFGASRLRLTDVGSRLAAASAVAGASTFAYRLEATGKDSQAVHPGWKVTQTLYAVDHAGRPRRLIRSQTRQVASVYPGHPVNFNVGPILRPDFYRIDILISAKDGRIRRFSEYIRAMRPRFKANLRVSDSKFKRGETANIQLVNAGSTPINYGYEYRIEYFENGDWLWVGPIDEVFPAVQLRLDPGSVAGCFAVPIGEGWAPGHYRVTKTVVPVLGELAGKRLRLGIDFHVVSE